MTNPIVDVDRLRALARARSAEITVRVENALTKITAEIEANDGIYPYNSGRLSQAEICRRAGISAATLRASRHKDTTRLRIEEWLKQVGRAMRQGRKTVRRVITERVDQLKRQSAQLQTACHLAHLESAELRSTVSKLNREIESLKSEIERLKTAGADGSAAG